MWHGGSRRGFRLRREFCGFGGRFSLGNATEMLPHKLGMIYVD